MPEERMVHGAGVELHAVVRGTGQPVLIVHGLASDAEGWAPTAEALADDGAQVIAYDRRGYGKSSAPEPYGATTVEEQAEDVAALLDGLGTAPAIVVGDGFGALIALDVAKRHARHVAGLVLSNPALLQFVADGSEVLSTLRASLEDSLRAGGPELAVEQWLDGRVSAKALARARAAHGAFFADFAGLASWPVTRAQLRAITAPAVVLTGPGAPPHIQGSAAKLAELLPGARRALDGDVLAATQQVLARA